MSIDKQTLPTELGTVNPIVVTLTSSGGFTGAVTVTPTLTGGDATWVASVDQPTVTLTANGSATVKATVMIPSLMGASLTGSLAVKVSAAGIADQTMTSAITAANQVSLVIKENAAGQCIYPTADGVGSATGGMVTTVAVGTAIHWINMTDDVANMIVHNDDNGTGINHESQTPGQGTPINQFYAQTPTAAGTEGWYCHGMNDPNNGTVVNGIKVQ